LSRKTLIEGTNQESKFKSPKSEAIRAGSPGAMNLLAQRPQFPVFWLPGHPSLLMLIATNSET
jgi:hypothetical protein